jgi:hypothetical protein
MLELTIDTAASETPDDETFESPNGSKWIVAVDALGFVTILKAPNIHWAFFECGQSAEEIGLPFEVGDMAPGVYEWTCSYSQSIDWESGHADGVEFGVDAERCLWSLPSEVEPA